MTTRSVTSEHLATMPSTAYYTGLAVFAEQESGTVTLRATDEDGDYETVELDRASATRLRNVLSAWLEDTEVANEPKGKT